MRAGEYYEKEEPDILRAALHYQRAGANARSAALATSDIWVAILDQGRCCPLRSLLMMLSNAPLEALVGLQVQLALGDILAFLGETQAAQEAYAVVITGLSHGPPPRRPVGCRLAVCLSMGTALEHQAPEEALGWLEQGLAGTGIGDVELQAALYNRIGSIRVALADYPGDRRLTRRSCCCQTRRANCEQMCDQPWRSHAWAGDVTADYLRSSSLLASKCTISSAYYQQHRY